MYDVEKQWFIVVKVPLNFPIFQPSTLQWLEWLLELFIRPNGMSFLGVVFCGN